MAFNDSTLNATGSVWCRAYTSDGFQVSLTLPAQTAEEAAAQLDAIRAAGFLPMMPEATAGELIETITMCVRRETVNKHDETVPVIDCYFNGGKFKWVTIYLDDREQVAEFERQSGLTVAKMPLYGSQAPLQAGDRATAKYETMARRPFVAVKVPAREKEVNGVKQMTYKFARYGGQPASAMPPVDEKAFSPRKPDTRKKADDAPAPHTNGKNAEPADTMPEIEMAAYVTVKVGKNNKPFYQFLSSDSVVTAYSFERAPFRNQGWDVDGWLPNEDGTPAEYDLDRYPLVDLAKAADGYWHVTRVTAYDLCDKYVEDQAS